MLLSDLSIKRPIFATVMILILVTLGLFSYRRLAIDEYPDVEMPILSIVTKYPGASPETVEREVSKRIEEAVNPIAGVKHVISASRESVSVVTVEFNLEVKINESSQEARAKINAIRGDLPQGIEEPIIQKLDIAALPIVSLAVRSERMSPKDLTTLVEKKIRRRFENVPGVGKVDLVGESKREVNVDINPTRLEALGMGVDEVIAGLQSENVNTPLGRMNRNGAEYPIRISGKPEVVERFKTMVIGQRNGRPILLSEIAEVRDGIEEPRSLALINGIPAVSLDILKQSGANTVGVVAAVKKEIKRLQPELPQGTTIEMVRDGSIMIQDSVRDVQETMLLGGILTVFIVFLFLNSWRSTVITGLTLPISVISSFIVMYFLNMTLNVLTLMGLSLAIGMLIDDAIVVRENIVRHLEHGKDHFQAAREGTSEIGLAVLATTLSIVAVFVPVAFMKGIVGRFFFQFGITVAFAVIVSLFVSFTLDPMLSSRWVDPDIERKGKRHLVARILDRFNDGFNRTADQYRFVIAWTLRHRMVVLFISVLAFLGGLFVFSSLQSEFFPEYDKGEFQISFTTSPDASIDETRGRVNAVLTMAKGIPEVKHTYATIGAGDTGTVRDAKVYVKLTERKDRKRQQKDVQKEVRLQLLNIPGILPSIGEAGGIDTRKPLLVNVRGDDIALLKKYSAELKEKIYQIPGIVDLEVTLEQDIPEFRLTVDRERAVDTGVMTANIVRTVAALIGGQAVSTYEDEDGDAVNVRVRLPLGLRQDPSQVAKLRLAVSKSGAAPTLVPLREVVTYNMQPTPSEIDRQDLTRQVVISANLQGIPLGTAMKQIEKAASRIQMAPGYRVIYSGQAETMVESFGYMAEALILAVLFVYLILAAQFESFIDPLSIMLSLPLSLLGMASMLLLTGDTINIMSLIGLIMLMGLVTKNAILLVDFAKVLRSRGVDKTEAIITAGRTRLRPIMMTTLAMIFGMLPLAFALGAGAEMRAPMARAVIGGLITSTFLTLLIVPVMYSVLDDLGAWMGKRWKGKKENEEMDRSIHPDVGIEKGLNRGSGLRHRLFVFPLILSLSLSLFLSGAAWGEGKGVQVLTLQEALQITAEKNKDIQKAREYRHWVEARYVEERAIALPQISITASGNFSKDYSFKAYGNIFPVQQNSLAGGVGLSQPIFTWGQIGASIRAAKVGLTTAEDQLRIYRQAAFRDVTASFYDILLARTLNDIALQNLEQKNRHSDEAQKRYSAGVATDYDVLAGKVDLENARPAVIRTENLIQTARERFRFLLGIGEQEVDAHGLLETTVAEYPRYEEALDAAWKKRPELSDLQHRIEIGKELVKIANAGDKPRLDFRGGYGWRYLDVGPDNQADGPNWSAGLFLNFPIFDGLRTRGKVAAAKSDLSTLRIEEAKLRDSISVQVRDACNAVRESGEIVKALSGTVARAERLLFMAEKGYEYGVKTRLDVDDAQTSLVQARGNLAQARRDYTVALVNLEWVKGTLGENREVQSSMLKTNNK